MMQLQITDMAKCYYLIYMRNLFSDPTPKNLNMQAVELHR